LKTLCFQGFFLFHQKCYHRLRSLKEIMNAGGVIYGKNQNEKTIRKFVLTDAFWQKSFVF